MSTLTVPESQRTITSLRNSADNQRTITSLSQTAHFEEIFFNYIHVNDVTNAIILVSSQKVDIDCQNAVSISVGIEIFVTLLISFLFRLEKPG